MSYGEGRGQTHEEQAHVYSKFYGIAYDLLRQGVRYEAVIEWLIQQGVELKIARKISTSAAESYQSARSEASQKLLQRGVLFLAGGLGFTALSYAAAGAGESYLIATGAIGFGLLLIITGLLLLVIPSMAPEDSLRVMFCLLAIACGVGLLILTMLVTDSGFSGLDGKIFYWVLLVGGYLLGGIGVWGLVDKRAMRLRTGDPTVDALTPEEVGKAGKFLLVIAGVIVLHVAVSQLFFRGGGEDFVNSSFLSPLSTAFDSPLRGE